MSIKFKGDSVAKHRDLADSIKEGLKTDGNVIKEEEDHGSYYKNLPEGLDKSSVNELSKYNSKFVTATHVAVGELAADVFKKEKKVNEVNASVGFFGPNDSIDINVSRSKTYKVPMAAEGEESEVTKHLVMKTTVETQSARGSGLKSIRGLMSDEFKDILAK